MKYGKDPICGLRSVPSTDMLPARLTVASANGSIGIVDMTYSQGVLTVLTARHRVDVPQEGPQTMCSFAPRGQGFLVSGGKGGQVVAHQLDAMGKPASGAMVVRQVSDAPDALSVAI